MTGARINDSVLGALERPALAWMSKRFPAWVTPNQLTALGFFGALISAAGYVASRWSIQFLWLACLGLVLNWIGDSLDGTLARLRRIERPRFGFFVDQTSDVFAQTIIFLSVGCSACARFEVACLALVVFLMAFLYTMIYAMVHQTVRITYFGFGNTEIRVLLLLGNLITLSLGVVDLGTWFPALAPFSPITIFDLVMSALAIAGVVMLLVLAVKEGRALSAEDSPMVARSTDPISKLGGRKELP